MGELPGDQLRSATVAVAPRRRTLVVLYGTNSGCATKEEIDARLTMEPPPRRRRCGAACLMTNE